jgi:hypothetical protein
MNTKDIPLEKDIATVVDYIEEQEPPKRKRGRPRKTEVEAKKAGSRNKVGRPKGDAAILNEYKARMLASPKSRQVLDKILNAALDDDHKGQQAAWKLVVDRILPVGMFEKDVVKGSGKAAVNITISGIGGEQINIGGGQDSNDYIDGDYHEAE